MELVSQLRCFGYLFHRLFICCDDGGVVFQGLLEGEFVVDSSLEEFGSSGVAQNPVTHEGVCESEWDR